MSLESNKGELHEKLEAVIDRDSFLAFVKALIVDREAEVAIEKDCPSSPFGAGANGWENGSIERYLEAAVRWAEDSRGQPLELPEEPAWKAFATFLHCGKIYE